MRNIIDFQERKRNKNLLSDRYYVLLEKAILNGLPKHEQIELVKKVNERDSHIKTIMDSAEKLIKMAGEQDEMIDELKELLKETRR